MEDMEKTQEPVGEKNENPAGEQEVKMSRKEKKDAVRAMKERVEELEKSLAKEKDDYLRLMAEFENYRRRSAAERLDLINTASEKMILDILPVIDDCERALKSLDSSTDAEAAKQGTQLIFDKLTGIMKSRGLKEIEAMDKALDTRFMESVAQFPVQEDEKKGKVFDVVQKGYMLGEKVIRFAKVVIGQ